MRVLLLSSADPHDFSSGGAQRSNHMRDALSGIAEVDTIVLTRDGPSTVRTVWDDNRVAKVNTALWAGWRERWHHKLAVFRMVASADKARQYDVIVVRYLRAALLLPPWMHRRMVLDGDDLRQSATGRRLRKRIVLRLRRTVLSAIARRARHVWLVDPRDRATLPGARTSMLPNTAAGQKRSAPPVPEPARRILMVGMFSYPPNEDGLIWFSRQVLPKLARAIPDVELHAVGRYYKKELEALGEKVVMRGFVDDLATEYARSDVVICPIFSGSGTQIKAIEALMSGVPTVVSGFSHRGFGDTLVAGEHLLVAEDPEQWVAHLAEILCDPARFAAMAERGRNAAERVYGLQAFKDRIVATLGAAGSTTLDLSPAPSHPGTHEPRR